MDVEGRYHFHQSVYRNLYDIIRNGNGCWPDLIRSRMVDYTPYILTWSILF
jgi:hypothetical protein